MDATDPYIRDADGRAIGQVVGHDADGRPQVDDWSAPGRWAEDLGPCDEPDEEDAFLRDYDATPPFRPDPAALIRAVLASLRPGTN